MNKKEVAIELRKAGNTYSDISKKLGIAKSTLHYWLKDVSSDYATFDRNEHLQNIRKLASLKIKQNRINRENIIISRVEEELKELDIEDKLQSKCIASMLYWAEGTKVKGSMTFANTDPLLSKLFITLLREGFSLDEKKFRIRLHLHSYHDIEKSRFFWSELLNIPLSQFGKIYIKARSDSKKFRENFAGICFIRYHSEALKIELISLGKAIAKKYVPVA